MFYNIHLCLINLLKKKSFIKSVNFMGKVTYLGIKLTVLFDQQFGF